MDTIKSGDVVQLKSGGPAMTVHNVENGKAFCHWFVNGAVFHHRFAVSQLEGAEADGGQNYYASGVVKVKDLG